MGNTLEMFSQVQKIEKINSDKFFIFSQKIVLLYFKK